MCRSSMAQEPLNRESNWVATIEEYKHFPETSANRLFIVSTNLDGFSLVNHERFAKFAELLPAKLFHYMVYTLQH